MPKPTLDTLTARFDPVERVEANLSDDVVVPVEPAAPSSPIHEFRSIQAFA